MNDEAGPGHNNPPTVSPSLNNSADEWAERLAEVFEAAAERQTELLTSYRRFEVGFPLRPGGWNTPPAGIDQWNDAVQGRAGDLRDKILALLKTAESLHSLEKGPILVAQRAVDGYLRNFRQPLDDALRTIRSRQTVYGKWQDDENRRLAEAEAKLLQEEAEAAAAEGMRTLMPEALQRAADIASEAEVATEQTTAPAARVHGDSGSVTSPHTAWMFFPEESDLMRLARAVVAGLAPLTYLQFNETRIKVAIRVDKLRDCPGLVIREEKNWR